MPVTTRNPATVPLPEALAAAEATLRGDGDSPSLTTALKQLVQSVKAPRPGEFTIERDGSHLATVNGYLAARAVARLLSRDTSGAYTMRPPAGSAVAPETWVQGIRAGDYENGGLS